MKIAIIGLGYVGLPLALQFARSGVSVIGLDIDSAKVADLEAAISGTLMPARSRSSARPDDFLRAAIFPKLQKCKL